MYLTYQTTGTHRAKIMKDKVKAVCFEVQAFWDSEASVWVATSEDVPGLVTEASTIEVLTQKLREMIPELIYCSIIPPPNTLSPSYQTAACPGVMLNCGSSNTTRTREFSKGMMVTGTGVER